MKRKYELPIDVNYVKSWGITEAVREFFQNSYDEEKENPENKSFFSYDPETEILRIGNKLSILKAETLLLGCTSKESNDETIGQFGEGYKIATVVALRTGHAVTIYNYGARETWTAKFVKSKKYNGRLITTFQIDSEFDWLSFFRKHDNLKEKNLIIEITNITEDEYEEIVASNLNLQKNSSIERISTCYGDILESEKLKGNVYVSGLFIYHNPEIAYGYDIKPEYLKLDRDRMAVNSFDLQYTTSKIWLEAIIQKDINIDRFMNLLEEDIPDLMYASSIFEYYTDLTYDSRDRATEIIEGIYRKFIEKYGKVIPVTSEQMKRELQLADNNVAFVSRRMYQFLNSYHGEDTVIPKTITYYERYKKLLDELRIHMNSEQIEECDYLLRATKYLLGGE